MALNIASNRAEPYCHNAGRNNNAAVINPATCFQKKRKLPSLKDEALTGTSNPPRIQESPRPCFWDFQALKRVYNQPWGAT